MKLQPDQDIMEASPLTLVVCDVAEHLMMVFECAGRTCITFAHLADEGELVPVRFPESFRNDVALREGLAMLLREEGYVLTYYPEQITETI